MTSSTNDARREGRTAAGAQTSAVQAASSPTARRRAVIGLAVAASVVTAGCSPLTQGKYGSPTTGSAQVTASGRLTFGASADSYVYADALDRNAGKDTKLVASSVPGQGKSAYLKFVVSGVPSGKRVFAHLLLHRTDHRLPETVRLSTAASTWSEDGVTGRNAPRLGSAFADAHPGANPVVMNVDVSAAVHGNGSVTVAITSPTPDSSAVFYSRESGVNAPSLVVDYGVAAPLSTPGTPVTAPTLTPTPTPTPTPSACAVSPILVPSCGVYWGVAVNSLAGESTDTALTNFESKEGRLSDMLHYYHVGAATFPSPIEIGRSHQGGLNRILVENWKPEQGHTWAQVAAGVPAVDAAIDNEANYLKTKYTSKLFMTIHHEPEDEVIPTAGSGMTAQDYAAMYRHVVLRLKSDGVNNVVYFVDYMGTAKWGQQSWFNALYPGDDVVDWIAEDPYSIGTSAPWRADFGGMVNRRDGSSWPGFYTWATTTHPTKPIMLAEWGVTEDPNNPLAKANFFNTQPSIESAYPAIKALVYWNAPNFPALGNGATRIDSSPAALAAFQQLARNPKFNSPLP